MINFNRIGKVARIALVATVISGTALAVSPAQARDSVTFGFNFSTGNGVSFSIGSDAQTRQVRGNRYRHQVCLEDRDIRRGLRNYGFYDIRFLGERGRHVRVKAEKDRWNYTLRVNRCSGNIDIVDRSPKRFRDHGRGGAELHFRFR